MNLCSAIAINGKALPGFSLVWRYNASEEGRMFTVPLDGSATADRARALRSRSGASPRNTRRAARPSKQTVTFLPKRRVISIR